MKHRYDSLKVKNPYVIAWAKATGIKDGDEWHNWKYMNWITDKHEEFREASGMMGQESNYSQMFVEWLDEKI